MRKSKYIFVLLAIVAGMAWADDRREAKTATSEREVPVAEKVAGSKQTSRSYPRYSEEAAAEGVPYSLRLMDVDNKEVTISWLSPEATDGIFEDFETHDDFTINSSGSIGWTYIDGDNTYTYTWTSCDFPNQGQKMAYIIMNPYETSPSVDDYPGYQPVSGEKMLVDFAAVGAVNNDFIISPELSFSSDFHVSFWAKSYSSSYIERIKVGYSTSGTSPSNFTFVSEDPYLELPAEWTLVEYTIPQEAKYVTINCVSDDAFMLQIDDIFIGTNEVRPGVMAKAAAANPVVGFNVYRDGVKVNSEAVDAIKYTDTVEDYGTYTYTVSALYKDGTESAQSEALEVEVPDIRLLPFEDDFDDWTMDEDKWTTVADDDNSTINWSIDYYTYGLVDPCATYNYSSMTNYDQSLITQELNTTDRDGTYLRFNLKLSNYTQQYTDYLSVEVTSDDGATWTEVYTYDNTNGEFDWTVCQFNIGQYLTDNLFKVRWRAHGVNAYYIDYWYVDDIKVWIPEWTTGSLTVTSADGIVANCPVTLTSDSGAIVEATTDENGVISIDQLETGTYTVDIAFDGYNIYSGEWVVSQSGGNTFTANLQRPVVSLSDTAISVDIPAESSATKTFSINNTGDGPVTWSLRNTSSAGLGDDSMLWDIQGSFDASGDLQTSVVFDGENYYTTSSTNLGDFWKYDKEGNLVEQFRIPDMYYILYDLTYDGRYFYGSDYSNRLFQLDFVNRRIAGIIEVNTTEDIEITHCSYDPNRDGFWIGSWSTICFIDRDGNIKSRLADIDSSSTLSVYGSAYDDTTPGGPYLWLANLRASDETMLDRMEILQYDLNTRKLTDVSHLTTDVPGYKVGSSTSGVNYICGISSTTELKDGTLSLIGVLKQSPSLIFSYTLCETDPWLSLSPRHGTIEAGSSQEVSVVFDGRDAKMGDSFSADIDFLTLPEVGDPSMTLTLNAVSESSIPRPVSLAGTAGDGEVALTWEQGSANVTPLGYNVYRDGVKANSDVVTETSFTDKHLVYGEYSYKVTALYSGDQESIASDSVSVLVKNGAPYYAPLSLEASIENNKDVSLEWESPLANANEPETLSWASGENDDQMGFSEGGIFYAASVWEPADLTECRNKRISSVSVQLVNPCTYLALRIIKDGETIYRKPYYGDILYDGTFTEVEVADTLYIDPGSTYYFAFQIMNDESITPLSMDSNAAVDGKGNMLSLDGSTWFPASYQGIDGNFNIRINLTPADEITEEEPAGYNVYRDGERINTETVTSTAYADVVDAAGTYSYTVSSVYADGGESPKSGASEVTVVDIGDLYAPTSLSANVYLNRDVTLRWSYPTEKEMDFPVDIETRPVTTAEGYPEYVNTFLGTSTEMAVASDNKYIYTSIYSEDGRVNKYSLDGEYLGYIIFDDLEGIRNLTYDGEYFYASDNQNSIYKLDMESGTVLETISISEYARHLAYVPDMNGGKGGFEVGDWETSIYVLKDGSKVGDGPTYLGAAGTAYYDGLIYAFEQGNTENSYIIGIYDFETTERVGSLNIADYAEIPDIETTAAAGGMSTIETPEGITLLALCLQQTTSYARFIFLDLSGPVGVRGYNVYRNGEKLNDEVLTSRYYSDPGLTAGVYDYTVETVYIDGSVSDASDTEQVVIVEQGDAEVPENFQAVQSTYGYNVLLSFTDPDMYSGAESLESFETATAGSTVDVSGWTDLYSTWTVTSESSFDGGLAITAKEGDTAVLLLPADNMTYVRLAARNADDHNGKGTIDILYSTSGTDLTDFILLESYSTTELWQDIQCELPAGTDYVAIRKQSSVADQYVDAVALYTTVPTSGVYGFDVFRNGEQINDDPVEGISYKDYNLLPGHYDYQVRSVTYTSAVSELTDAIGLDLDYDNGGLAPTGLTASLQDDRSVKLNWTRPALDEPVYLRWHDGICYDAAGLSEGGAFYAGVRWLASDLKDYDNYTLTNVEVYVNQVPEALYVMVWEGNNVIRTQFVPTVTQYSFNNIQLTDPVKLNVSKDLRIVVYVEHNEITVPLGYDAGPAKAGRGNLYSSDGTSWTTLDDDDVDIDANWNISIGLSPYASSYSNSSSSKASAARKLVPKKNTGTPRLVSVPARSEAASGVNAFEGYNVYCNNSLLNDEYVNDTVYVDESEHASKYLEYKVAAVYSTSGESFSNKVTLLYATDIEDIPTAGFHVEIGEGVIRIIGAHTGDNVALCTIAGQVVYSSVIGDSYIHEISTASLAPGTYVVSVGKESFKVLVGTM